MSGKIIAVALIMLLAGAGGAYYYLEQQNQGTIAALTKQATDAENRAKALSTQLAALNSQVEQLDTKSKSLEKQLSTSQAQVAATQALVADLTSKNTSLETSVGSIEAQLNASKTEAAKLTADLASVNQQLTAAKLQVAQTKAEYDSLSAKYQALVGTGAISDPTAAFVHRDYVWSYKNDRYTMSLDVPTSLYNQYSKYPRMLVFNHAAYVAHPDDDAFMKQIASKITALASARGLTGQEPTELAISWVQRFIYTLDNTTKGVQDYPRYPVETLVEDGGDCEDTAILMASVLREMGRDVVFVELPNHVALGVSFPARKGVCWPYEGKNYYYVETTGENSVIGTLPDFAQGQPATLVPVKPTEMVTFKWSSRTVGEKIEFQYTAHNNGTAAALGYVFQVGFDGGGNTWYNPQSGNVATINPGATVTGTITLTPPAGKHTRLVVYLYDPYGKVYDLKYGTYFDT